MNAISFFFLLPPEGPAFFSQPANSLNPVTTCPPRSRRQAGGCEGGQTAQERRGVASRKAAKPTLLAGGNPQIAKADGDAPVQAYIAAMPGWKSDVGRRLDALIVRTVPGVRKAVKWNSPFYGVEGQGWFLSFHCFTKYVKVAFFRGTSLRPVPPASPSRRSALPRHPRGRPARRSSVRRLGEASQPLAPGKQM
jgi:hypothetical protein